MRQSWGEFLRGAGASAHGVQIYGETEELADSVAAYLAAGFERDDPAVLVAPPESLALFADRLGARGWGLAGARKAGLVVVADAEQTLDAILAENGVDPARFDEVIGGLIDRAGAGTQRPVRIFGEMVDLLCRGDRAAVAEELEQCWNDLARRRRFSLLCGYRLDVFEEQAQTEVLPRICRSHSHVLPARNYARFARAVDEALREVLGPNKAATVYVLVSRVTADSQAPLAQSILMWVTENLPQQSAPILAAARAHYARPAA